MDLPPLFTAMATAGDAPFAAAVDAARGGCDAGLVVHDLSAERLRAAVVFAPEVPLDRALAMLPLCGVGLQNALGALAPPEVAVHLDWDGGVRVNGALCGALSVAAGPGEDAPGWLVIGLRLNLWAPPRDTGDTPGITTLTDEGCGDIGGADLLAAWLRHTLLWLNTWEGEGTAPLHREWTGLAHGIGADTVVGGQAGAFIGADEQFAMIHKRANGTVSVALNTLLKDP